MIHSKGDIDANKQYTIKRLLSQDDIIGDFDPKDPIFDGEDEEQKLVKGVYMMLLVIS